MRMEIENRIRTGISVTNLSSGLLYLYLLFLLKQKRSTACQFSLALHLVRYQHVTPQFSALSPVAHVASHSKERRELGDVITQYDILHDISDGENVQQNHFLVQMPIYSKKRRKGIQCRPS